MPDLAQQALLDHVSDRLHGWQKRRCRLRQVTIEATRNCNLACRHCYLRAGGRHPHTGELSFLDHLGLAFSIRQSFGTKVGVAITGGEPLCRPDLLPILRFHRTLGLSVSLATNGTLIDRPTAARLAAYVNGVSVSLDGLRKTHDDVRGRGAFRRALRGLFHLRGRGIPKLQVKTGVHRGNLKELPALHAVVRTLGATDWHMFPVEPHGRAASRRFGVLGRREYRALCDFFDAVKDDDAVHICFEEQNSFQRKRPARECGRLRRCGAGISSLAVLAEGSVVACVLEGRRNGVQGNVRGRSLPAIWSDGFRTYRSADWRDCGVHLSCDKPGPPR